MCCNHCFEFVYIAKDKYVVNTKETYMQIIVDFIDSASEADIANYITDNSLTVLKTFNSFGKVYLMDSAVELTEDNPLIERISLGADTDIKLKLMDSHTPLEKRTFTVNEDNWWKVACHWDPVFVENAEMTVRVNPKMFNVYLMDSGIDSDHIEFVGQNIVNLYSVDDDFTDYRGHGTSLASLITGNSCSISSANIFNVKIVKEGALTSRSELLTALDEIQTHYNTQDPLTPAVINMSWAIPYDEYINYKIQVMIANGIIVVAAAGNSGELIKDVTPACIPAVFTIGAYNDDYEPADFSNYTSDISNTQDQTNYGVIDYWAPGTNIRVATLNDGYGYVSGTSSSAAIATAGFVYNTSSFWQSYFNKNDEWMETEWVATNTEINGFANHRTNILTMPEKYSEATNKIITMNVEGSSSITNQWITRKKGETLTINRAIGETMLYGEPMWSVEDVKTINMTSGELPPGFNLDNGSLSGSYTGNLNEQDYQSYDSTWNFTSFDNTITTLSLNIRILNNNFEPPTDENNPEYDPTLLITQCDQEFGDWFECTIYSCFRSGPSYGQVCDGGFDPGGGKFGPCYCVQ